MNEKRFECEANYTLAMAAAKEMARRGILTEQDIRQIETILRKKYCPVFFVRQALQS